MVTRRLLTPIEIVPMPQAGPPVTDTWQLGSVVCDATGQLWRCTTAGTPGAWVRLADAPQAWTTAGTVSWVVPAGWTLIKTLLAGAGAGGQAAGGHGAGGGAVLETIIEVTPGETLTLEIGAGGAPGLNNGGATRIRRGSTVLAAAGGGVGTTGGTATGSVMAAAGGDGAVAASNGRGGAGGAGLGPGGASPAAGAAGLPGVFGGGGSGRSTGSSGSGGRGGNGVLIIERLA